MMINGYRFLDTVVELIVIVRHVFPCIPGFNLFRFLQRVGRLCMCFTFLQALVRPHLDRRWQRAARINVSPRR